jgi:hypothetical protein
MEFTLKTLEREPINCSIKLKPWDPTGMELHVPL